MIYLHGARFARAAHELFATDEVTDDVVPPRPATETGRDLQPRHCKGVI